MILFLLNLILTAVRPAPSADEDDIRASEGRDAVAVA
jgi:hypothetical protein